MNEGQCKLCSVLRSSLLAGWFTCHLLKLGAWIRATRSSVCTHTQSLRLPVASYQRLRQRAPVCLPVWCVTSPQDLRRTTVLITLWQTTAVLLWCSSESGRSIICAGRDSTLRCRSGQVLMIDGGFYGRKSLHYCRSTHSRQTAPTPPECGWMDIVESLTGKYAQTVVMKTSIITVWSG